MESYTKKLYYEDVWKSECKATILDVTEEGVILDQTVAYAEGGGQVGDSGVLIPEGSNEEITFVYTKKMEGRLLELDHFPSVTVENKIVHVLKEQKNQLKKGITVVVRIDKKRRYHLMATHTAVHLMLMGIEEVTDLKASDVRGAKIDEKKGRLDFKTEVKFTQEDLTNIGAYMKRLIDQDMPIRTFPHEGEPEAMYFECDQKIYACGGTHLQSCKGVGECKLKRKGMGKELERIMIELLDPKYEESKFDDMES